LLQAGIVLGTLRGIAKPLPRNIYSCGKHRIPCMLQAIRVQPTLQQAMVRFDHILRRINVDAQNTVGICLRVQQNFTDIKLSGLAHAGLRFG
jgi:hypothetical protein